MKVIKRNMNLSPSSSTKHLNFWSFHAEIDWSVRALTAMKSLTRCIDQRRRLRIYVEYLKTCLISWNFEQKEKAMSNTLLIRKEVRISLNWSWLCKNVENHVLIFVLQRSWRVSQWCDTLSISHSASSS